MAENGRDQLGFLSFNKARCGELIIFPSLGVYSDLESALEKIDFFDLYDRF